MCPKFGYPRWVEFRAIVLVVSLRWLDGVFLSQYPPSLSIAHVAINKDLEKLPP